MINKLTKGYLHQFVFEMVDIFQQKNKTCKDFLDNYQTGSFSDHNKFEIK